MSVTAVARYTKIHIKYKILISGKRLVPEVLDITILVYCQQWYSLNTMLHDAYCHQQCYKNRKVTRCLLPSVVLSETQSYMIPTTNNGAI
jgi:hypothetical protein